jgi:hypothetical protein
MLSRMLSRTETGIGSRTTTSVELAENVDPGRSTIWDLLLLERTGVAARVALLLPSTITVEASAVSVLLGVGLGSSRSTVLADLAIDWDVMLFQGIKSPVWTELVAMEVFLLTSTSVGERLADEVLVWRKIESSGISTIPVEVAEVCSIVAV